MSDHLPDDPPSPFIQEWIRRTSRGRALDVAMGRGRHARLTAAEGFRTFGVDIDPEAVAAVVRNAAARGVSILGWCADLTVYQLPRGRFDLLVVARYLQRNLWADLAGALAPGGLILYETFTEAQRSKGRGPTSPDHLLKSGELRDRFPALETLFYEETLEPDAVARLAARKR